MAMAAIVQGIREQIVHTIEIAGPTTFYVMKVLLADAAQSGPAAEVECAFGPISPAREAERIAQLPEMGYAPSGRRCSAASSINGARTQMITIFGADERFQEIQGGELVDGRWFTAAEMASGAAVVVLDEGWRARMFGRVNPLGKRVRVGGTAGAGDRPLSAAREHLRAAGAGSRRHRPVPHCSTSSSRSTRRTRCSSP